MSTKIYKHEHLTAYLSRLADSLQPGDRLPSQTELMREFGMSDRTVLRSLEDLRQAGWIVRRNGSGTYVTEKKQRQKLPLPNISTELIAVLAMAPPPPIFAEIIHSVESALREQGRAPLLILDSSLEQRGTQAREHWSSHNIKGVIHVGSAAVSGLSDVPLVTIGETYPGGETRQVSIDNVASGRCVGEHLWALGHRRVAIVFQDGLPAAAPIQGIYALRLRGLREFWEEQGLRWDKSWCLRVPVPGVTTAAVGEEAVAETALTLKPLLDTPAPPTALFVMGDELAVMVVRALEMMARRVPEDISVVGFNDSGPLAAHFRPALTTIRMPSADLGRLAVAMLQSQIADPTSAPVSCRLSPELIVRASSGPAASE